MDTKFKPLVIMLNDVEFTMLVSECQKIPFTKNLSIINSTEYCKFGITVNIDKKFINLSS